jgi:hypothetical protein
LGVLRVKLVYCMSYTIALACLDNPQNRSATARSVSTEQIARIDALIVARVCRQHIERRFGRIYRDLSVEMALLGIA